MASIYNIFKPVTEKIDNISESIEYEIAKYKQSVEPNTLIKQANYYSALLTNFKTEFEQKKQQNPYDTYVMRCNSLYNQTLKILNSLKAPPDAQNTEKLNIAIAKAAVMTTRISEEK